MKNEELYKYNEDHESTYCPEDNKLRLYVGRVSREEFLALKSEGWKSTPKQDCDFVAAWTVSREDTAISYSGVVLDEDQSPQERAADRAERFAEYRDKRTSEALGHADSYDEGPAAHGYQNQAKADKAAARHDRKAGHALTAWDKAEYWTSRTAGVINSALYKSGAGVRMGRIKKLEAEARKADISQAERVTRYELWETVNNEGSAAAFAKLFKKPPTTEEQIKAATENIAGSMKYGGGYGFRHPRPETCSEYMKENDTSLYSLASTDQDPLTLEELAALYIARTPDPRESLRRYAQHLKNRLAYENQMLEAQGGRAEQLDIQEGGFIGSKLILKVNKSRATGRAVSVLALVDRIEGDSWSMRSNFAGDNGAGVTVELERLKQDAYTPPTDESRAAVKAHKAAVKAATPAKPKLLNPTDEDAQRLQDLWNAQRPDEDNQEVQRMTQAEYKARSGGNYSSLESVFITEGGKEYSSGYNATNTPTTCKVRKGKGKDQKQGYKYTYTDRVIILTDKPQKKLPPQTWNDPRKAAFIKWSATPEQLNAVVFQMKKDAPHPDEETAKQFAEIRLAGLAYKQSTCQIGLSDKGAEIVEAWRQSEREAKESSEVFTLEA